MARKDEAVIPVALEDEIAASYSRYARYTILHRAIPDVRDGLKPVQRRIIYAQHASGNLPDRPYRKCAKTVGDVMGNYHPHGDQSIYDALVRMAQPWKMNHPLVDGHGNFGSMDDDPPAAMRYTESRLAPVALTLLADLEKRTVPLVPTFDRSDTEPAVLPSRFPNLLVNGCSGLSTGFATEVPPHNLAEVVEAALVLSKRPETDLEKLLEVLPGPDFPTGGTVVNGAELRQIYERGRGRLRLRARTRIERETRRRPARIVIEEIPFGVVKSDLVAQMEQLRLSGAVRGVADVRDESDREGLRIVVELERSADAGGVLNFFFKKTSLQVSVPVQMVAIADGAPRQLGLRSILEAFLKHRRDVVRRRSRFELEAAKRRLHQVEGLIRALDLLDEVIALIRSSRDRAEARRRLREELAFSEEQADTLLDLRLHRLTSLQVTRLQREAAELGESIERLERILSDERQLERVVRKELRALKREHARERRTRITDEEGPLEVALTVMVPPQRVIVTLSSENYIKRSHPRSDLDPEKAGVRPGDHPRWVVESNTIHRLLLFSEAGNCHKLGVHALPEARWAETGSALVNLTDLRPGQRIAACLSVDSFDSTASVVLAMASGKIKRTPLAEFETNRSTGITAVRLAKGDELVRAWLQEPEGEILLATRQGRSIRFELEEVPEQGRNAAGVRGITLEPGDRLVDAQPILAPEGRSVAVFTSLGKGKRTPLEAYPRQSRGGKGVRSVRRLVRRPHEIAAVRVAEMEDEPWWACTSAGRLVRLRPSRIPVTSRDGNAYGLLKLERSETLVAVAVHEPWLAALLEEREAGEEREVSLDEEPGSTADPEVVGPESDRSGKNGGRPRGGSGGAQLFMFDEES